jgi:hypothetical protein
MASYKNTTRKRKKKTYRKKYRKNATKRMMVGGLNPYALFNGLRDNLTKSFSIFGSKAKQEATTLYDTKKKEVKETVEGTKAYVDKKRECLAACARI